LDLIKNLFGLCQFIMKMGLLAIVRGGNIPIASFFVGEDIILPQIIDQKYETSRKKTTRLPGLLCKRKFSYLTSQTAPTPSSQPKMRKKNQPETRTGLKATRLLI